MSILAQTNGSALHFAAFNGCVSIRTLGKEHKNHTVPLEDLTQFIQDKTDRGIDIYILPNHGGHVAKSITHISALFIDVDAKDKQWDSIRLADNSIALPEFHLKPSMIVRSGSGGFHAYWILNEPIEIAALNFKESQQTLANHYQSDPKICDLPRIMRVPGSNNHKINEFKTTVTPCYIEKSEDVRYDFAEILTGLSDNRSGEVQMVIPSAKVKATKQTKIKAVDTDTDSEVTVPSPPSLQVNSIASINKAVAIAINKLSQVSEGGRNNALTIAAIRCLSVATLCEDPTKVLELKASISDQLTKVALSIGLSQSEISATLAQQESSSTIVKSGTLLPLDTMQSSFNYRTCKTALTYLGLHEGFWLNLMDGRTYLKNDAVDDAKIEKLSNQIADSADQWDRVLIGKSSKEKPVNYICSRLPIIGVGEAVSNLANIRQVHPMRDALAKIKRKGYTVEQESQAWTDLQDLLHLSDVCISGLQFGLKQAVAGFMNNHQDIHVLIVLFGGQGTGKTGFLNDIFTFPNVKPFVGALPKEEIKDSILPIFSASAVICDEIATSLKSRNCEATKATLSKRLYTLRKPYGKGHCDFYRSATYWGTSNEREILTDKTGNRRILVLDWTEKRIKQDLKLADATIKAVYAELFPLLWSSAITAYKINPELTLSDELLAIMSDDTLAMQYDQEDVVSDVALYTLLSPRRLKTDGSSILTPAHVRENLAGLDCKEFTDWHIKTALEQMGLVRTPKPVFLDGKTTRNAYVASEKTVLKLCRELSDLAPLSDEEILKQVQLKMKSSIKYETYFFTSTFQAR